MKLAVWMGFAVLSLAWTGLVWAAAAVTRWVADVMASANAVDWALAAGAIRLPGWLTWWLDASLIESIFDGVVWVLETANQAMPWFNSAAGWLVVLLWVGWSVGMLLLLLMAAGMHWLVARGSTKQPAGAK